MKHLTAVLSVGTLLAACAADPSVDRNPAADAAVLQRQPDGSWKIDRLQSTPVSIEGAMAEH